MPPLVEPVRPGASTNSSPNQGLPVSLTQKTGEEYRVRQALCHFPIRLSRREEYPLLQRVFSGRRFHPLNYVAR